MRPRLREQPPELIDPWVVAPGFSAGVVGAVYLAAIVLPWSLGRWAAWTLMGLAALGVLSLFFRLRAFIEGRGARLAIALGVGLAAAVVVILLSRVEDPRLAWVIAGVAFTLALGWIGVDHVFWWAEASGSSHDRPYYDTFDHASGTADPSMPTPASDARVRARRELRDLLDDAAAVLGPAAEKRLAARYGPDWLTAINAHRAADGLRTYEPSQVRADPRAALSVIGHDPAFERTVGPARAKARFLLDVANRLHHPHRDVSDDELVRARAALRDLLSMASRI